MGVCPIMVMDGNCCNANSALLFFVISVFCISVFLYFCGAVANARGSLYDNGDCLHLLQS